ncbi:MAG: hypothetical protein R3E36_11095 [Nitrosomonas sp.]|nr:hypothetical protein [Nitrosomonas sp.]MCP5251803.1 hypothetical protein [Burkholderiales bacterium]MDR4521123.1 hypothetical protein [Nitrosomonas sp.]
MSLLKKALRNFQRISNDAVFSGAAVKIHDFLNPPHIIVILRQKISNFPGKKP